MRWIEAIDNHGKEITWKEAIESEGTAMMNLDAIVNCSEIKRMMGKSMVISYPIFSCKANKIKMSAKAKVSTLGKLIKSKGWVYLKVIRSQITHCSEDELVTEIKSRLRKGTKYWHNKSTMTELWRMCRRLGRLQTDSERKQAKLHIVSALRKKGLIANPFNPMVVKIPRDAGISAKRIKEHIRRCLGASTLPRLIARKIRVKVIEQEAPTGIKILKNFKTHIEKMEEEVA